MYIFRHLCGVPFAMNRVIGLTLGVALFMSTLVTEAPQGMGDDAWLTAGVGMLMATWWATEAIPVPVTSLLPIVLFPLLGLSSPAEASRPYAHPVIYLLLGGFVIAMALQRWNLHRRIALTVLSRVGNHPHAIFAGFMGATAFLSMWISNTATTIMMIPIALSLSAVLSAGQENTPGEVRSNNFTRCLILCIVYSASIGGLGTLVGTPPNAMLAAFMSETYQVEIGFAQWLAFGLPVVVTLVPLAWWVLTKWVFPFGPLDSNSSLDVVKSELAVMGPLTVAEKRITAVFVIVALAWIARPLIQQFSGLAGLNDTIIAIVGVIVLFILPSGDPDEPYAPLLDWNTAADIPWGIIILFGGGLSLANQVNLHGLAEWLGDSLVVVTSFHLFALLFCLVTLVIFLTELTSNTATTATLLPLVGSIAVSANFDPMLLAPPMALAASCAFMLPVATPPNAIAYASGELTIAEMVKAGLWINIIGIIVISLLSYLLIPLLFL